MCVAITFQVLVKAKIYSRAHVIPHSSGQFSSKPKPTDCSTRGGGRSERRKGQGANGFVNKLVRLRKIVQKEEQEFTATVPTPFPGSHREAKLRRILLRVC